MKTFIVSYLPSDEKSWTGRALQSFLNEAKLDDVTIVDLCVEEPPFISKAFVANYGKRNYGGQELTQEETLAMEQADLACTQLCECDALVLAFPMYNFSLPGAVKAWFDNVIQYGKAWTIDQPGNQYRGLLSGKKVVVFMASGGTYIDEPAKSMDHAEPLARLLLGFLGMNPVEFIRVQGTAGESKKAETNLAAAQERAISLAQKWYHHQ